MLKKLNELKSCFLISFSCSCTDILNIKNGEHFFFHKRTMHILKGLMMVKYFKITKAKKYFWL